MNLRGKIAIPEQPFISLVDQKNDLEKTASEIKERGGSPIPVKLNHNNDLEVEQFSKELKMNKRVRTTYLCTVYASRIMVENRTDLIVNISSGGGLKYLFNVPYGIGKVACDRMTADCAVELKNKNVTMVSIWPGPVKTEEIKNRVLENHEPRK
ncbi:DHRS1 [Lepeophtheirus salmonis]|uniref:DHRS1 n=1 Tax=Lepeophtheirus salmonis TaxID=72036 RepID=A0A817FEZ5_LEPSM|nr:DHRS1 [Lepeophtheirus salmonis]CAG9477405.1 DHRS1 [Lepeophtheirus salmonis]